jgi:hypothetical protein
MLFGREPDPELLSMIALFVHSMVRAFASSEWMDTFGERSIIWSVFKSIGEPSEDETIALSDAFPEAVNRVKSSRGVEHHHEEEGTMG